MDMADIKRHWENLAEIYSKDLKATTKTPTIKKIEISALINAIESLPISSEANILEVGCGNGFNCISIAEYFDKMNIVGLDYIESMIDSANKKLEESGISNAKFYHGDILELKSNEEINAAFDVVFTDRCLINLNSIDLQVSGIANLFSTLVSGGYLIMIENFEETYEKQNQLREKLGLEKRTPDQYNLFLSKNLVEQSINGIADLVGEYDFASLHDLMLYVIVPYLNEGSVDYSDKYVAAITELLVNCDNEVKSNFGGYGQNRLLIYKKH